VGGTELVKSEELKSESQKAERVGVLAGDVSLVTSYEVWGSLQQAPQWGPEQCPGIEDPHNQIIVGVWTDPWTRYRRL